MMIVRKLRLQNGWSQDQLAQISGLSIRTIQRIERGQKPGLESLKALAAVFEIQVSDLLQEATMNTDSKTEISFEEQKVITQVREIKSFYSHLISYVVVVSGLFILNLIVFPDYIWAKWVALGWGIGLTSHGVGAFELFSLFSPNWEKRQIEKRLGRKL